MLSKDWLACLVSFPFSSMAVPFSGRLISSGERIATNICLLSKPSRKKTYSILTSSRKRYWNFLQFHSGGRGIMAGLTLSQTGQQFMVAVRWGSAYPAPVVKPFRRKSDSELSPLYILQSLFHFIHLHFSPFHFLCSAKVLIRSRGARFDPSVMQP